MLKVLFLWIIGSFISGIGSIWITLRDSHPFEVTLAELAARPEKHDWLLVKGCKFMPLDDGVRLRYRWESSYNELFIPVRVDWTNENSAVPLLIVTKDPKMLGSLEEMDKATNLFDAAKELAKAPASDAMIFANRDVSGLVRSRFLMTDEKLKVLHESFPTLTDPFVILDEGATPSAISGWFILAHAVALFIVWVVLVRCWKAPPPVPPKLVPPVIQAPTGRAL